MDGADACSGARGHPRVQSTRPHTHPIQIGRRDHAAPNDWRRRVANVDDHQRVGITRRHVSVRASHGDAMSLCVHSTRDSARVKPRLGISRRWRMMDGADASATRRSAVPKSAAVAELGRAHPIKKRR